MPANFFKPEIPVIRVETDRDLEQSSSTVEALFDNLAELDALTASFSNNDREHPSELNQIKLP